MDQPRPIRERLPPLGALRVFEAAARHGSLSRAAEELHVTHGAVSKQIKILEAELGGPLFIRRNRAVFLTEPGRLLAARLQDVFGAVEAALIEFKTTRAASSLVVSCEPTLCLKFLIPNLGAFSQATGLDVRVLAAGGRVDFRRDPIDLAIRRNDFPIDAGHHTADLGDEAMGPVCEPGALARYDPVAGRIDLPRLHTDTRPDAWAAWTRLKRPAIVGTSDRTYEHFSLAIEAALAGQGVALASIYMVHRDLMANRLAGPCGFWRDGTRYVVLSREPIERDDRVVRFVAWFSGRMSAILSEARPPDAAACGGDAQSANHHTVSGPGGERTEP